MIDNANLESYDGKPMTVFQMPAGLCAITGLTWKALCNIIEEIYLFIQPKMFFVTRANSERRCSSEVLYLKHDDFLIARNRSSITGSIVTSYKCSHILIELFSNCRH